MDVLAAIENTSLGIWVRESTSLWAYPTIIFLHSVGLTIIVGLNAVIDLRLLGFAPRLPIAPMAKLFPLMWFGFWINALSGVALLTADATTFLVAPLFYIKLFVVALAAANLILIRRWVFRDPLVAEGRSTMRWKVLGATSLVLWAVAMTAGRLTAYLGPAVALAGLH
jgi:hypothetical protein